MNLKSNKGITGVDIAISMIIFIVFISLISGLFYNVSSTATKVERKSVATNLAIEVIEALKVTEFSNLTITEDDPMTVEELNTYASKSITIPNGYSVEISIENPVKDGVESLEMGNAIKVVSVEVTYQIGKSTENVYISTLVKNI